MILMPDVLLIYWRGPVIPWRQDNIARLKMLYPAAQVIEDIDYSPWPVSDARTDSEIWRRSRCMEYRRALWIDSDVYLKERLPLDERAAMADEYHTAHWSICWSGDRPDLFNGVSWREISRLILRYGALIPREYFVHYKQDRYGNRTERIYNRQEGTNGTAAAANQH